MEGYCRYQISTGSPVRKQPILLDRSDLILAESFDPYLHVYISVTLSLTQFNERLWMQMSHTLVSATLFTAV